MQSCIVLFCTVVCGTGLQDYNTTMPGTWENNVNKDINNNYAWHVPDNNIIDKLSHD